MLEIQEYYISVAAVDFNRDIGHSVAVHREHGIIAMFGWRVMVFESTDERISPYCVKNLF